MAAETLCMGCMTTVASAICPTCGFDPDSEAANPLRLPLRTLLGGQYDVGKVLGHGGFGITYLGWDRNLHFKVAIKEYLPGDMATRSPDGTAVTPFSRHQETFRYGLERFLEEARALARFREHPGIVDVVNFFRDHGTGYLVMSYVEGRDLKTFLAERGGRIPSELAVRVIVPVMDALREVHAAGMLHRDISPDNIYLTRPANQVKLMDFGAARYATSEKSHSLSIVLKPGYAPEEQYRTRGRQGPWTDVYALGATFYKLITGTTPPESLERKERDELVAPSRLGVAIEPRLEAALLRSLAVRQADRFQSIEELQEVVMGRAVPAPAPGPNPAPAPRPEPAPEPSPGPTPAPGHDSLLDKLEPLVTRLAAMAAPLSRLLGRVSSRLRAPADLEPRRRPWALGAAAVFGGLGALWALSRVGFVLTNPGFGFFPGTRPLALVQLLVGLGLDLAVLAGAVAAFQGDRRGITIVWSACWLVCALAVVGFFLNLALVTSSPYWAALDAYTRGNTIGASLWPAVGALLEFALVLFLVARARLDAPGPG